MCSNFVEVIQMNMNGISAWLFLIHHSILDFYSLIKAKLDCEINICKLISNVSTKDIATQYMLSNVSTKDIAT